MKKPVKITLWILAVVLGGLLLALLTTPLWLGSLSAALTKSMGPKYTGTPFKVAKIHINPFTGSLRVKDFHLGNPQGYDVEDAVSVQEFNVDVAPLSLLGSKIHVKNIDIIDPYVSYIGNNGTNNFDAILANVKKNLDIKEKDDADEAKKEKDGKKIVIDRFHIEGVKFKMGIMPTIPIPVPITLTDLGKEDSENKKADGLTMKEMGTVISSKISGALSKAGGGVMNLFSGDAAKGLGDAAKSVGDGASKAAGTVTDAVKNVGSGAADAAGKAVDMAGDAAKSVGEGAKNLLKGAGNLFGGGDKDKK